MLASAPDVHQDVLITGIAALTDELSWFQRKASERGLDLPNTGWAAAAAAAVQWDTQRQCCSSSEDATAYVQHLSRLSDVQLDDVNPAGCDRSFIKGMIMPV